MNSILDALRRQVGAVGRARTRPSTEYRGALAAALSHLLEYLISPRDPEELLLQSEEPRDDSSLAMLGRFCSAYKEATAGYRQMFLSIFQHKYESVVAVLAHDGCTESTTPKWRVACFSALVQLLKTLQAEDGTSFDPGSGGAGAGEASGLYLSAKVLQIMWRDHHLERIVGIAAGVDEGRRDFNADLPLVRRIAQACLVQLALTELGANAIHKIGIVSQLIRSVPFWEREVANPAAPGYMRELQLITPCRILTSMLRSIPFHMKLVEEILRWVQAMYQPISDVLIASSAMGSLDGLQNATAVAGLLASVIGSIEPARREPVINSLLKPDKYEEQTLAQQLSSRPALPVVLNESIMRCWELLRLLGSLPSSPQSTGESTAWSSLQPSNAQEEALARQVSMPAPRGEWQAWNAFDAMKFSAWWGLFRSIALVLQRTARLGVAPDCGEEQCKSLARGLITCVYTAKLFPVATSTAIVPVTSPDTSAYYASARDSSILVLENLTAFAVERLRLLAPHGHSSQEKKSFKAHLNRDLVDLIATTHGASSSVYGPPHPSDVFLRKATRFIDESLHFAM